MKWAVSVILLAWAIWFIRVWRILKRADAADDEWAREESRRRRALGAVTKLSAYREIERKRR